MKKRLAIALIMITCLIGIGALAAYLLYNGFLRFNYPSYKEYPIQGIDVSNHQNEIDWAKLDKKRVQFALIKATEGGDFKDKSFLKNWQSAQEQGVTVGAYHFFTFCKSGEEQAQNYIETVPVLSGSLPPTIDLEYSGNCKLTKTKEELLRDIDVFIEIVEKHYKRKVLIYVLDNFYNDFLVGRYPENPLWLRDVYHKPVIAEDRMWTFWQYSNRGRLDGIEGFVDLNVFRSSKENFRLLLNAGHE
ncbi:MAG: GH25 family lysozyme [Dysgonomonas sp.]|nr:GH25 family lysozyme [Dysgonomonas sp.]